MVFRTIFTIIILAYNCFLGFSHGQPTCNNLSDFKPQRSDDCRTAWRCFRPGMEPIIIKECPEGQAVTDDLNCVLQGSSQDPCALKNRCGLPQNPCRNDGTCIPGTKENAFDCVCKYPYTGKYCEIEPSPDVKCSTFGKYTRIYDPEFCQTYFDCGDIDPESGKPRIMECQYPLQFDVVTSSCRHYSEVRCGNRKNVKSQCQYNAFKARQYGLDKCETLYPSCEGKSDGLQPHKGKSALFIVCESERLVKTGFCKSDEKGPQIATKDGCKSIFEIPQSDGGMLPSCKNKPNGYYPLQRGSCGQFFLCEKDETFIKECPSGFAFDVTVSGCRPKFQICRPCGYKECARIQ